MMFASFIGDAVGTFVLVLVVFLLLLKHNLSKFDTSGAIRGAAKDGIARMIGRWLR
jgi:glycerol uptake facilitator-like aquaporin